MSELFGTNVTAPILPGDTSDNFPTHIDDYGKGGYRSVSGIVDRNSIPQDRRSPGMMVQTRIDGKFWILDTGLVDWIELPITDAIITVADKGIVSQIGNQEIVSGIKSFKNYNDTKFYGRIRSQSGLFSDLVSFNEIRVYGKKIGSLKGGTLTDRENTRLIRSGLPFEPGEEQNDFPPETGIEEFGEDDETQIIRITKSGIIKDFFTGDAEKKEGDEIWGFPKDDFLVNPGFDFGGRPQRGPDGPEDEDELFDDESPDNEGIEEEEDPETIFDIIEDAGDGDIARLPDGGGGGGGAARGGGGGENFSQNGSVYMLFDISAPKLKYKDHYSDRIRNIRVLEKGSNWSTGLKIIWGAWDKNLYPGETYTANLQTIFGTTGILASSSGGSLIVSNNSREYRTSGLYNIGSPMYFGLHFDGKIGGYRPDWDLNPWTGTVRASVYPAVKRYWGASEKEILTSDEITGLLSGEYAFDPRQAESSAKIFVTTGRYMYFAWPVDSGFNNINFFKNYEKRKDLESKGRDPAEEPIRYSPGYKFVIDKRDVYFQYYITGVRNSVNYVEDYYVFRNRWILNGADPIRVRVIELDESL